MKKKQQNIVQHFLHCYKSTVFHLVCIYQNIKNLIHVKPNTDFFLTLGEMIDNAVTVLDLM